jgi:RNA polymerase sigma-70 factor (ECF subfamily)
MSSIALRYSQDEQEALVLINEGYYKIFKNIASYNAQFALATWMRNVLVHHIISEFRKHKNYRDLVKSTHHQIESGEIILNAGELKLHENDVLRIIQKLPAITKKVFNLFAIDGYKHQEIAELLGIQEGTSKWHVSEARKKLKQEIEKMNPEGKINMETKA